MNEDELINDIKELLYNPDFDYITLKDEEGFTSWHNVFEGLLDLYQKEKEKNKKLEKDNKKLDRENQALFEAYNFNDTTLLAKIKECRKEQKNSISKDKIRAKIKELENLIETNNLYEECWNKIEVLKELLEEE